MKKTFILEELDCGHCAQKIEDAVNKLEGVSNCKVRFLTQKMEYEVSEEMEGKVEEEMRKLVKRITPDVEVKAL